MNKPNITIEDLICMGIDEDVAAQFIWLRGQHKKPFTQLALKRMIAEAEKAGMSIEDAMILVCEEGWKGFKAEYVQKQSTVMVDDFMIRHTDTSWRKMIN